jgi:FSR family fosmidomycin resistance protein-like MFS transporter
MALGHSGVDVYQGSVAALVPYFVAERAYSYAAASGVVLAASLLSSVVQPLFGALTDRRPLPWLLPLSALLSGLGVALSGVVGGYISTLMVVALAGIGVAAYHPEAARVARVASGGSHTAMSWFSFGGNAGFAAAPPLVALAMAVGGLGATPLLFLPAVGGAVCCLAALRAIEAPPSTSAEPGPTGPTPAALTKKKMRVALDQPALNLPALRMDAAKDDWPSFLRLSAAIATRSIVFVGLGAFISLYARQRIDGGSVAGTAALSVLYIGSAAGTLLGGALATRHGRLVVICWSYALTGPAIAGVLFAPGALLYPFIALTSAGLYVPFSLHITLGQDYLPRRVGTASGVTLGLAVSVGGLASPLLGLIADTTSLRTALAPLIVLPAIGLLLVRTLREPGLSTTAAGRLLSRTGR